MLRLDYLSCVLTVVSTFLVGRKRWSGLVLAGINSLIVCFIGFRTSQFGFIPANVFCIGMYGYSVYSWRKEKRAAEAAEAAAELNAESSSHKTIRFRAPRKHMKTSHQPGQPTIVLQMPPKSFRPASVR